MTQQVISDENKPIPFIKELKHLRGVNHTRLKKIFALRGLCFNLLLKKQRYLLQDYYTYFFNLENNKSFNSIAKYQKIKNYRGIRHMLKLPTRGQRTHTNANTIKRSNA